jgi:hypothetical protein
MIWFCFGTCIFFFLFLSSYYFLTLWCSLLKIFETSYWLGFVSPIIYSGLFDEILYDIII